jgi:hypothetical protein
MIKFLSPFDVKFCNVIWTSNNTEQPWCSCLQTFTILHFTTNGSDEFGWEEVDKSDSLTLLLLNRYAQFSQALSSIKLRLTTFMPYGMEISINILIYFTLPKLVCILLLVFHKVLKWNRCLTMKMDSDVHGSVMVKIEDIEIWLYFLWETNWPKWPF